ncbi:hypothetical protein QE152_g24609 [Popillia japonica]|uniref:Uncharacterized protein n=1 Tax=Popillia japonica TaxID=7064 RepID=A0AAW1K303_POPJA
MSSIQYQASCLSYRAWFQNKLDELYPIPSELSFLQSLVPTDDAVSEWFLRNWPPLRGISHQMVLKNDANILHTTTQSKRNKSPDGSEERCKYFAHHHPKTRHMESYQAKIHKNSVPYFVSRNLFDQKSLRK